jgi:hypothetical protein
MTTDGAYLYIIRANINGGMYKVGTGRRGTAMGRVYLEKASQRVEELSWVHLKGRLYLRLSSREIGSLEVYSCESLELEDCIQLYCPIMNMVTVQNLNKTNPILTDGQYLYLIGKYVNVEKALPSKEDEKKEKAKKKGDKEKKAEPTGQQRVLEFILHEYDIASPLMGDDQQDDDDEVLAQELYLSYNGFFSISECKRALNFKKGDISAAAQWLADEGEKERSKRAIAIRKTVIIAQSEIVGEPNNPKNLRNNNVEVSTKEGSVLTSNQVHDCNWVVDADHLYCYAEEHVKVFSKSQSSVAPMDDSRLIGTLVRQ